MTTGASRRAEFSGEVLGGRRDGIRELAGTQRTIYRANAAMPFGLEQIGGEPTHLSAVSNLV
jgi:hypothetical protein